MKRQIALLAAAALLVSQIAIAISDTGEGMSEEVLGRASHPFFTTKEPGRGIGLGLFLAGNVITQLGGQLEFRSTLGQGTEAIVTLPPGKWNPFETEGAADQPRRIPL